MKLQFKYFAWAASLLLLVIGSGADFEQVKYGSLIGIVIDAHSSQPIPGATVIVEGTQLGAVSGSDGRYRIDKIPIGTYAVYSSSAGYSHSVRNAVEICDQCEVELELKLAPGSDLDEKLQAEYERPLIQDLNERAAKVGGRQAVAGMVARPDASYGVNYHRQLNTEEYAFIEESGFLNPRLSPLSTFSIDVDAASFSNMRRYINSGQRPPVDAIRTEELVNYFDYQYPSPDGNHPVEVYTELGTAPWNPDNLLLHIGLQAEELAEEDLGPSNLVFLLDVSGSMNSEDKIGLVKKSFKLLTNELSNRDRVAVVVYAGAAGLVLPSTRGDQTETIRQALDQLSAGGSTAGGEGIKLAYKVARENLIPGGNNRVILATDGDFNIGVSDTGSLVRMIKQRKDEGIGLTVLGFGGGNLKDSRMEAIADKGDGNYYYIDSLLEGKKVFVDQLRSTLYTVARDVKIQVEFNPAIVGRYRLIGYENRALNAEDFADDKKDAGEMGSGHTVTALYEIVLAETIENSDENNLRYQNGARQTSYLDELGLVKVRYKPLDSDSSIELDQTIARLTEIEHSDAFDFSASVAMFSMLLRSSEFAGITTSDLILDLARASKGVDRFGYRADFIRLAEAYSLFDIVDAGISGGNGSE